ncbi:MAG: insulinase family protein, partial [Rhodospirillaceae bacterium]|nr:insulinase family protein [Rhodospirillaceae bacterium]
TEEVREKRGLAYSIYSYLQPQAHGALISGGVGTENSRVAETIDIIRQEWRRLVEEGISDEELKNAKTYVTGSFPLQLTSTGRIARMLVTIQYFDLGIDYLDRRDGIINAVTQEDVKRVARHLFDADDLLFVIVGRPEGIEQTRPPPSRFAGQG